MSVAVKNLRQMMQEYDALFEELKNNPSSVMGAQLFDEKFKELMDRQQDFEITAAKLLIRYIETLEDRLDVMQGREALERRVDALTTALQEIVNEDGRARLVMSSLQWQSGFIEGVKLQAQRARKALGLTDEDLPPANLAWQRIAELEAENQRLRDWLTSEGYQV
jgi:hypothetical protein